MWSLLKYIGKDVNKILQVLQYPDHYKKLYFMGNDFLNNGIYGQSWNSKDYLENFELFIIQLKIKFDNQFIHAKHSQLGF